MRQEALDNLTMYFTWKDIKKPGSLGSPVEVKQ